MDTFYTGPDDQAPQLPLDESFEESITEEPEDPMCLDEVNPEDLARESKNNELAYLLIHKLRLCLIGGHLYANMEGQWRPTGRKEIQEMVKAIFHKVDPGGIQAKHDYLSTFHLIKHLLIRLAENQPAVPPDHIAMLNGLYAVTQGRFQEDENLVNRQVLHRQVFEPGAQCPQWLQCLSWWFDTRPRTMEALQEFFGYCLLHNNLYKKALYCSGHADRSVIAQLLLDMIGEEHTVSVGLDKWETYDSLKRFTDSRLNVTMVNESKPALFYGAFSQMMSGLPVWVPSRWVTPTCKHALFAVNRPRLRYEPMAVFNSLLLVDLNPEAPPLTPEQIQAIRQELPGIIGWALAGATRLSQQGGFTTPQNLPDYTSEENPVAEFIALYCHPDEQSNIPMPEFREIFQRWHGFKITPNRMGRLVSRSGYCIESTHQQGKNANCRSLMGMTWKDAAIKEKSYVLS